MMHTYSYIDIYISTYICSFCAVFPYGLMGEPSSQKVIIAKHRAKGRKWIGNMTRRDDSIHSGNFTWRSLPPSRKLLTFAQVDQCSHDVKMDIIHKTQPAAAPASHKHLTIYQDDGSSSASSIFTIVKSIYIYIYIQSRLIWFQNQFTKWIIKLRLRDILLFAYGYEWWHTLRNHILYYSVTYDYFIEKFKTLRQQIQ